MPVPWMALATIGSGLFSGLGSVMGGNAQSEALSSASADQRMSMAQQLGLFDQQMELSRPLIQTRDNALNAINAIFGLPQVQGTSSYRSGGSERIPLNGVNYSVPARGVPNPRGQAFFDPVSGSITNETGQVIATVPEGGGVIPGLVQGTDNQVRITADGRIEGVGNRGVNDLGRLPARVSGQAPQPAAQPNGIQSLSDLVNTPQFEFMRQEANQGAERLLNARGFRGSGRELDALTRLNEGLVGQRVDGAIQNLYQLAGFGNAGTGLQAQSLQNQAAAYGNQGTNLANLALQQGNVRASTLQGGFDAASDTLASLAFQQALRRSPGLV